MLKILLLASLVVFSFCSSNQNNEATTQSSDESLTVKAYGEKGKWLFHYPGKDLQFAKTTISQNTNGVFEVKKDSNDVSAKDDIFIKDTLFLIKNQSTKILLQAISEMHFISLPQFKLAIDMIPNMPTVLKFTPFKTTIEMKESLKNPNFEYTIECVEDKCTSTNRLTGIVVVQKLGFNIYDKQ